MALSFRLIDIHGRDDGRVDWDRERGELRGRGAETLSRSIEAALAAGRVRFGGLSAIPVSDPLHDPRDMAVVVAASWQLPAALQADFPRRPSAPPAVAVPQPIY